MVAEVFQSKAAPALQQKQYIAPVGLSFAEFLYTNGNGDLSNFEAIRLYEQNMPLYNAVDMRARLFSEIPVRVWDRKAKKYVEHDSTELLYRPNADVTQNELLYSLASFLDITGDTFMVATGIFDKPPKELMVQAPQRMNFSVASKQFGLLAIPASIQMTEQITGRTTFRAEETATSGGVRFRSDTLQEIWHARQFNPRRSQTNFWGMSRARPLWIELQQYASGNTNNLSMLERGSRLSMVWINNRAEELTETQWQRIQEEAEKYRGSKNAGGNPVLDGMDVREMQASNRDMEYQKLQTDMLTRTSVTYGIPLPFLLAQSMTLNNLTTASVQLYDMAVLPLTNFLYAEMTRFLMPRYKGSENLEFRANPNDIESLRTRLIDATAKESLIGVSTDNELRAVIGHANIGADGDTVYKPANMIPAGESAIDGASDKSLAARFIKNLENSLDANGDRKFTDAQIIDIATKRNYRL